MNKTVQNKLANHGGKFISIRVQRKRGGTQSYSGKVKSLTASTLVFSDTNANGALVRVPLRNIVG
jgi:hypothetical protein